MIISIVKALQTVIMMRITSNVTTSSKAQSTSAHFCRYVAPPAECYYDTLLRSNDYFSSSSMVSHTFSVLCVYSKFGHHPDPIVPNFDSFVASIAKLANGEKFCTQSQSLTHSPSLFDAPGTEACASEKEDNNRVTKCQKNVG